jgi:diguanylate cyclase (GGDEF)-like protein/PAS domain S-box-containing protein
MSSRAVRACYAGGIVALTALYYLFPGWHLFTWAAIGLSGAAAIVAGVRIHRPERPLAWYLLAAGMIFFTAGDAYYNALLALGRPTPFPAPSDVLYLLVYPFLAGGFVLFIRSRSGDGNRAALLDALVPTVGLGLLSWVYWIAPYTRAADLTVLQKVVSVGYPLGDVLALAMMLRLLAVPGRRPPAASVLAVAVVGVLVSDIVYGQAQLNSDWTLGGPIDLGWVVFYGATGFAALDPSMRRLTEREHTSAADAGGRRLLFMAAAALIAPAVLYLEYARDGVADALIIAGAAALMFLLVLARAGDLLKAQRLAGTRERALREAAATLASAATEDDVLRAMRAAVATLMPPDQPYTLTVGDGGAGPVELAAGVPGSGFDLVLRAGMPRLGVALIAASPAALRTVRPSMEALFAQIAVVIERISLTGEINRRDSEAYFRTLIQSASDVILIVGEDDRIGYASPSAEVLFGWPDLAGTPLSGIIADTHHEALLDVLIQARAGHGLLNGIDLAAVCADRRLLQVECAARDLRADPTVGALVLTVRDVTDRRRLENDLAHQAFHDGLTGLANRVLFRNRLEHAFALAHRDSAHRDPAGRDPAHRDQAGHDSPGRDPADHDPVAAPALGVLFIDLDDFKEVNDTLGHAVGDQLLVAVGRRIADTVGSLNTAARMGGDEFAVLVEQGDDAGAAEDMAARIVAALSVPVEVSDGIGGTHNVSGAASVGVATSRDANSATELLRHADLALYLAKSAGKSTWRRYQSVLQTAMVERLEMRTAMHEAVEGAQFVLQYQPIVDLPTESVVGVESLVRWQHPVRGLLGPGHFIELAEESGAIVAIGAWVLRESLRQFAEWRAAAPDGPLSYISVNVSARQFRTPGFVDQVRAALGETGSRPEWLLLEITESLVLRDADQVWADLRVLRDLGVRIAIDDFGTGYSSLSYLRQMPVDVLKIDKSFIDDVFGSRQQRALVNAIVTLARNLDLAVVAEGIEDAAQRALLAQMGCPYGQGYLFSRPVWPAEVATWLTAADTVNA